TRSRASRTSRGQLAAHKDGERDTNVTRHRADLPFDAETNCSVHIVAVGELSETGVGRYLAKDRIFVIVPVVRAADANPTPQPLVAAGEFGSRHVHGRAVQEFIKEVANSID